jgi:hypothetical protein
MNIAVYITGHGFGHASRVTEVLKSIAALDRGVHFLIRTGAPEWFFRQSLPGSVSFEYSPVKTDVGVVQKDALRLSKKETLLRLQAFSGNRKSLLRSEWEALKGRKPLLVFADIPPLAFDVADVLGVKSAGMTNFSWDWIYEAYVKEYPAFTPLVEEIRESYGKAHLLLRLPFHGDFSAFPAIRDIPLVARHASFEKDIVRARLAMPPHKKVILLSFGGYGVSNFIFARIPPLKSCHFVTTFPSHGALPHVQHIREEDLKATGMKYPDLVNAADLVVGKPGYGLVSECIAHEKPFLYTTRGDFVEYGALVKGVRRYLQSFFIARRELLRGAWEEYIEKALAAPLPSARLETDGAMKVAEIITDMVR